MNASNRHARDLRILLLQIRDPAQVRHEEYASFVAYSGLAAHQIGILNVFDTPEFDSRMLADRKSK